MSCQTDIVRRVMTGGAGYVLAVNDNQPTLLAHLRQSLNGLARDPQGLSVHREAEKGHGRIGSCDGHAAIAKR